MNWKSLKLLNQLFTDGETSSDILQLPLIKRWLEMGYIESIDEKRIAKTQYYDSYYCKEFLAQFQAFNNLLITYNLSETNFKKEELSAFVKIEEDKKEIISAKKSQKEIATVYFGSAKYYKVGSDLHKAVIKILDFTELPRDEHDQQYLHILHCENKIPKAIILCENDNQIRKSRLKDIELWFAGGRNTAKLKFVIEPEIPFYYLCDWDNRGIEIYQGIKQNIFPNIQILIPQEPLIFKTIAKEWKTKIDHSLFSNEANQLLERLIPEKWIEEESINHRLLQR